MGRAILFMALVVAATPVGAAEQGRSFILANQTGQPLASLMIRDFGQGPWRPLLPGLGAGANQPASVTDDDCAFDIRGSLPGGDQVTWNGVNLCEVRVVTLNRRPDGTVWVDYA